MVWLCWHSRLFVAGSIEKGAIWQSRRYLGMWCYSVYPTGRLPTILGRRPAQIIRTDQGRHLWRKYYVSLKNALYNFWKNTYLPFVNDYGDHWQKVAKWHFPWIIISIYLITSYKFNGMLAFLNYSIFLCNVSILRSLIQFLYFLSNHKKVWNPTDPAFFNYSIPFLFLLKHLTL